VHNPAELRSPLTSSDSLEALPDNHPEDEELRELQERFKLANITADPVFYPASKTFIVPFTHPDDDDDVEHAASGSNKSGSGLPFFQKLRKQL
jgi:hypothetical protein